MDNLIAINAIMVQAQEKKKARNIVLFIGE